MVSKRAEESAHSPRMSRTTRSFRQSHASGIQHVPGKSSAKAQLVLVISLPSFQVSKICQGIVYAYTRNQIGSYGVILVSNAVSGLSKKTPLVIYIYSSNR